MSDKMTFPETVDEFMEEYKIVDTEKVYTNSIELVPIFRMEQWFEHLPAVPHEMTARELLHTERRMFSKYLDAWSEYSDYVIEGKEEEAVQFAEKWAREHPEKKTYAEDFFEKFPKAEPKYYDGRGKEQMIPIPCRQHCYGVVGRKCNGIGCSCSACWNEEMEGEE